MRKFLPFALLVLGAVLAVVLVFHQQIFQQNASVVTLSALAIKGTVYVDSNTNGKFDSGEKGYTATPKPLIRLALFTEVCHPTPTPKVSGSPTPTVASTPTPTPTLAPGCKYVCPMVACRRDSDGNEKCPACSSVCVTPSANGQGQIQKGEGSVQGKGTVGSVVSSVESNNDDIKDTDMCRQIPLKVVPCTLNDDGTYTCIANNVSVSRFSVIINPPVNYIVTSDNNPFTMTAQAYQAAQPQSVDFGIAKEGSIRPTPTSSAVSPACIPQPDCIAKHTCTYATPPQGWCAFTGKPLTSDELNRLMIYLNTLLRKHMGR